MKNLKNSLFFKIGAIALLGMILMIPTAMIESLIYEREATQKTAISEVSSKWSGTQTISGPYLTIPYLRNIKQFSAKDSLPTYTQIKEYIYLLPSKLIIDGKINPERRYRGIYEVVVYNSKLNIAGSFAKPSFSDFDVPKENIQFDKAFFTLGVDDLRGIEEQITLNWAGTKYSFNPGVLTADVVGSGIHTPVNLDSTISAKIDFSLDINLKGSQYLYFTPVGKVTDVNIRSSWSNPSFNGAFLPDKRHISSNGFSANWNILHLNRNYPQVWTGSSHTIGESAFGIDLLLPVDNYQKTIRTVKYAILFIAFTFIAFFFIEILNRVFIHPIQYILVGIALLVFYTLLLSISEYINFDYSFIIAAASTLLLIAGYVKAILKSTKFMLLISGILLILYTFIFVVIQLQDFALLIGSIGLFIIVGFVMFFSRKIDWYNIYNHDRNQQE